MRFLFFPGSYAVFGKIRHSKVQDPSKRRLTAVRDAISEDPEKNKLVRGPLWVRGFRDKRSLLRSDQRFFVT